MGNNQVSTEDALEKFPTKVFKELDRIGLEIPYIAENGKFDQTTRKVSWWTNGFWGGINWKLYLLTKNEQFKKAAESVEEKLDQSLDEFIQLHHDVGFLWLPTAILNYKITGNEKSFQRGIHAANILAARFNIEGNYLRAWNGEESNGDNAGVTIIDSMMNISILFWCWEMLSDPRFKHIAISHATTVGEHLVRPDGSVAHVGAFNSETGEFMETRAGQGFGPDSAWSRGQGWALYGFTNCYKHTKNQDFLDMAKKVAHYVITQLTTTNYLARIDYRAPKIPEDFDASASAITACGLLELSRYVSEDEKQVYLYHADRIIETLNSIADFNPETDGIINEGAVRYQGTENKDISLVYADYFYLEALLKSKNQDMDIW